MPRFKLVIVIVIILCYEYVNAVHPLKEEARWDTNPIGERRATPRRWH
jgi:hypothetical protein